VVAATTTAAAAMAVATAPEAVAVETAAAAHAATAVAEVAVAVTAACHQQVISVPALPDVLGPLCKMIQTKICVIIGFATKGELKRVRTLLGFCRVEDRL
jgi:hypothetical protein